MLQITGVKKIYNPELYGMYILWKTELEKENSSNSTNESKETILYHVTSPQNALRIAGSNIDWRKTKRSRFGIGSCFSPSPEYADKYSSTDGGKCISHKQFNF